MNYYNHYYYYTCAKSIESMKVRLNHYFKSHLSNMLALDVPSPYWLSSLRGRSFPCDHTVDPSKSGSSLPCGHRDLSQGTQHDCLLQPNKSNERRIQEVYLANKHVGSFCITWQFFHELILQLHGKSQEDTTYFQRRELKEISL